MVKFHGLEVLVPKLEPIIVKGKLQYHESSRSRSILRLRKRVRKVFQDLDGREALIGYQMEYYHKMEELLDRLEEIPEGAMPFLFFLVKDPNITKN